MKHGSLIEQLLKARYYPNSDFLEANLGSSPSYTWRGIWEARWVVRKGMRWRVGDGENIRVWQDPWLPGPQSRCVLSPRGQSPQDLEVGTLICPINKCWKIDLLQQLFLPFEVERILNIPISRKLPEDVMFWELEADGCYSVNSAYRALLGDSAVFHEASPSSESALWQIIRRAKVLPRVKLFAWRACHEALPTRLGLSHRISSMDGLCSHSGGANESGFHAIHMCPRAKEVWRLSSFQLHQPLEGTRIADLWHYNLKDMQDEEVELFLTLCWAIWNARCKSMIAQEVVIPSETFSFAVRTCEDATRAAGRLLRCVELEGVSSMR